MAQGRRVHAAGEPDGRPAPAGTKVQYWLIKPPNFDASKKYPVVFLIHGGPQGAWEDAWSTRWNPSLWAAQGWVVAAPNPRGSTGFGQKFVDEISRRLGRQGDDRHRRRRSTPSSKLPFADSQRMGIAGASYGGYAVNWILGHTNRFKAAVTPRRRLQPRVDDAWRPRSCGSPNGSSAATPWTPKAREQFAKWSPHLYAHNIKTPTLIITNELDFRVPVDQGLQMFTVLRRNGVPSRSARLPGRGPLGAQGAQQPRVARGGVRVDEEVLQPSGGSATPGR